jgi:hypothetical protein
MHTDVCSMFARTPWYTPARPGIHSTARMQATRQNDSSRHILVLLDSISRRRIEYRSGLLISGLGFKFPATHHSDLRIYLFRVIFWCMFCPRAGSVLAREFSGLPRASVKSGSDWSRPARIDSSALVTDRKESWQLTSAEPCSASGRAGCRAVAPPSVLSADLSQRVTLACGAQLSGLLTVSPGLQFSCRRGQRRLCPPGLHEAHGRYTAGP